MYLISLVLVCKELLIFITNIEIFIDQISTLECVIEKNESDILRLKQGLENLKAASQRKKVGNLV